MEVIQLYIFLSMEINFQEIDHRAPVKLWLRNTTTKFDISVFSLCFQISNRYSNSRK